MPADSPPVPERSTDATVPGHGDGDAIALGNAALRSFFDHATFQMGVTELTEDQDMLLVAVNPAAAEWIGLTPAEAQGKRISELGLPGPNRGVWLDRYLEAMHTRRPVQFEQWSNLPADQEWWAVTLAWIGTGPSGRPRFSYVVQDITQRKLDERTNAAVLRISDAAHTASSLLELFGRIHEIIGGLLPAENFFVALYDPVRDEISFPYYVDQYDPAPPPQALDDGTLAGRVVKSGQSLLFTPETPGDGAHIEEIIVGTPSLDWLGVPLKWQRQTIGALVVQTYAGDVRYVARDQGLLEFVSGQVAAAIARKQAEQAIIASETRFRLLFEQNLAGVFRSTAEGRILQCNDAFARMLGFESPADALGSNAADLYFDADDRARYVASLRAEGGVNSLVMRFRRKDGGEMWGMETVSVILGEAGEPEVFQGTVVDFSGHKLAEAALQQSESRLEEAQRIAHVGSWNWEAATGVLSWSDELCRIYGLDPEKHQPSYADFLARLHSGDRHQARTVIEAARDDHRPFEHEVRVLRPDGSHRTILDQGEVLLDKQGKLLGMRGAALDITRRKLTELLERERGAVLEQVAQNQPLGAILASVARMLENQRSGLRACVLLVDDGTIRSAFGNSLSRDALVALEGLPATAGHGSFGRAAESVAPATCTNVPDDPDWQHVAEWADRNEVGSSLSSPIVSAAGGVLGTLSLFGPAGRRARTADHELLASACRLATVAIEHRALTDQLSYQAQHDALTGLPNRLLFQDRLAHALAQASRRGTRVAVLYMDLDRFKHINDTLGHAAGDALLRLVAARLDSRIRGSDTLARLGGDEFTVVLDEISDTGDAMRVGSDLIEAMRAPFRVGARELYVTASMGMSLFPDDGADAGTLMANADVAMYRAKDLGRDNVQWFSAEMNELARERLDLENDLRRALGEGELDLHYQPQVDGNGRIAGVEALLRWNHPALGNIPPDRFVPLAEESGLIVPIGEWVLRRACAQAAAWRRAGHHDLRMSVNVSAVQFKRADWVDTVRRALRDSSLDPAALELEITESLLLQSVQTTSANLFELRELGVGIAIDDFGTGYSSLSYLHRLPITTLKIDRSFVREIDEAPRAGGEVAPVVRTIIALARNLGMSVVAEGVETPTQRQLLLELGCDWLQGFLLSHPLDASGTGRLLAGGIA